MLDTITLGTFEHRVKENNKLVKRVDINNETGLVSEKYFYNNEFIQVTTDNRGFRVKTSIPKLVYGINYYAVGVKELKEAVKTLRELIKEVGVEVSDDGMKVMRVDIFKNIRTNYSFRDYAGAFRLLSFRRTFKKDYVDGYLIHNTLREVCFYDKIREMIYKLGEGALDYYQIPKEANIMRGEVRFLQHREVKDKLGVVTINDLIENYEVLEDGYKEVMKAIFSKDLRDGCEVNRVVSEELVNEALTGLRVKGKEALLYYGFEVFSFADKQVLLEALQRHYSVGYSYKLLNKIEELKKEFQEFHSSVEVEKLYNELKEKFLLN